MDPIFEKEGEKSDLFWRVNGSIDFGILPPIPGYQDQPLPIRLHVGTPDFGEVHLKKHMRKWPKYMEHWLPAKVLHTKLQSTGSIYVTESTLKLKVALHLKPSALLVVQYRFRFINGCKDLYWSVISLHPRDLSRLDGDSIGRYSHIR